MLWDKPRNKNAVGFRFPAFMAGLSVCGLFLVVLIFSLVYYTIDTVYNKDEKSMLRGVKEKTYFNYFYYTVIITTTLGLGEIVPYTEDDRPDHKNLWIMRTATMLNIVSIFFINDFIDSSENFKLA